MIANAQMYATYLSNFILFFLCVHVHVSARVAWCAYGGQRNSPWSLFFPLSMWILGIELRSPGFVVGPFMPPSAVPLAP